MTDITSFDDTIDVRDVIARVEELRETKAEHDADEAKELTTLEKLLSELAGYGGDEQWEGDWYPITLIRDSYFTEAVQQLCEDTGDLPNGIPGYFVIDWEATANNLRVDYSSVDFDGTAYWYR